MEKKSISLKPTKKSIVIFLTQSCLGSISEKFDAVESRKVFFTENL